MLHKIQYSAMYNIHYINRQYGTVKPTNDKYNMTNAPLSKHRQKNTANTRTTFSTTELRE